MTEIKITPTEQHKITQKPNLQFKEGQLVRHYKGGLYRISLIGTIEADQEPAIVYQSIDILENQNQWIRPVSNFSEYVKEVGEPRFMVIAEPTQHALQYYLSQHPLLIPQHMLEKIKAHYMEPARYYHAWWHILDMFQRAKADNIALTPEQIIAILYHDIVYVPGMNKGVNELLSVKVLIQDAPHMGDFRHDLATLIIENTIDHVATHDDSEIVLDLDMASLSDDYLYFDTYNHLVWLENRHLLTDRQDFDTRRLSFLVDMLESRSKIFYKMTDKEAAVCKNVEKLREIWLNKYGK